MLRNNAHFHRSTLHILLNKGNYYKGFQMRNTLHPKIRIFDLEGLRLETLNQKKTFKAKVVETVQI